MPPLQKAYTPDVVTPAKQPARAIELLELFAISQVRHLETEEIKGFFEHFSQHSNEYYQHQVIEDVWYELRLNQGIGVGAVSKTIDWLIDRCIGFDAWHEEGVVRAQKDTLVKQYPRDQLWIGAGDVWTDYGKINEVVHRLKLAENDTFYDLGAGYGRVPIYAGLTTSAHCVGIEAVPHRRDVAARVVGRLGLTSVDMQQGSVIEQDISDGTAFYMYAPFSIKIYTEVMEQLDAVAADHAIRIASWGGKPLDVLPHLRKLPAPEERSQLLSGVHFYESV